MLTSQPDLIDATQAIWIYITLLPLVSFLAFQMDGIFVGATNSAEMRNSMVFALISFIAAHYLFSFADLDAALTAFIFYLGARGVYLAVRLPVLFTNQ
jgi:MATE family multidrug resistance protein